MISPRIAENNQIVVRITENRSRGASVPPIPIANGNRNDFRQFYLPTTRNVTSFATITGDRGAPPPNTSALNRKSIRKKLVNIELATAAHLMAFFSAYFK